MEFTTKISERDFVAGLRLASKSLSGTVISAFIYVASVLLVLAHLGAVVDKHPRPNSPYAAEDIKRGTTIEDGIMPLEQLCLIYLLLFVVFVPVRAHWKYRKDPSQRGENLVQVGPGGVSEESSMGSSSSRTWSVCSYWRESKRVFVLMTQSGIFYIFPKAGLSEAQREELRGILTAALPRK